MFILFDIGGTKMRLAGSPDLSSFGDIHKEETPADNFEAGMDVFEKTARDIAGNEEIEGVVGGIAGPLNPARNMLINAPNIPGWVDKPLAAELGKRLGAPVHVENDSAVVGLGEATNGAGRGYSIVAYITVSTGVGGSRLVNGKIDASSCGFEPGHQILQFSGAETNSLEGLVSGSALEKREGKHPGEIFDDAIWDEEARMLAYGLNNVAVMWSPEAIVLGGAMIFKRPGIHIEKVEEYFKETLAIFPNPPELVQGALEDDGGLYGAMELARQRLDR